MTLNPDFDTNLILLLLGAAIVVSHIINAVRINLLERRIEELQRPLFTESVARSSPPVEPSVASHPADALADSQVLDAVRRGNKIVAIKRYRELTGLGLKEAKDAVDELERRQRFG